MIVEELEYFGVFDVPYINTFYVKIKACDKRQAVIKFSDYLFNKGFNANDGQMYIAPMFSEYETI
jgi:hypothetical protein